MNSLTIDLEALRHNIQTIDGWVTSSNADASWTLVTKALCGHEDTLRALQGIGVRSMADSRLGNLETIARLPEPVETWYLRLPHLPKVADIVRLTDVSLNTEIEVIEALSAEAVRQNKKHSIIIMVELGDLREGVLPGALVGFFESVFNLPNLDVAGIGSNLGCLSGTTPNVDLFAQLCMYRELLELKFKRSVPLISAGTSIALPLLRDGQLPPAINHFRIGEAAFLGTDLIMGDTILGLRDDAFTLEVEVVEVKEKSMSPVGETNGMMPFKALDSGPSEPGERGYRALVTIGQVDTEISDLRPLNPQHRIVGASSDMTVVSLGNNDEGISVGESIKFRPSYGALVRLMLDKYVDKIVTPHVADFVSRITQSTEVDLPPIIRDEL